MLTITPEGKRWLPWIVFGGITAVLLGREMVPAIEASPAPARGTMALLRDGDAKVCGALDVHETLRELVRPAGKETALYPILFSASVLESFDRSVTKAVCRANVEIKGRDGLPFTTAALPFSVQPSADDANHFVVWASPNILKLQMDERITSDETIEAARQQSDASYQHLRATVSQRWLRGRWVFADAGSDACASDAAFDFQPRGRLIYQGQRLGWALSETTLTLTGTSATTQRSILTASADSFTLQDADENAQTFRRCAAYELPQAPATPRVTPPAQSEEAQSQPREPSSFEDPTT